jgi:hypothetical protein
MKSRYTNCNQAKLETICNNPTGFLGEFLCNSRQKTQISEALIQIEAPVPTICNQVKLEQIVGNPTGFLTTKSEKLSKISLLWR